MLLHWFYWYTTGMFFFILHSLMYRQVLVHKGTSLQVVLFTFGYPVFYGYLTLLDVKDGRTRAKSLRFAVNCIILVGAVIGGEMHLVAHARTHAQMRFESHRESEQDPTAIILGGDTPDLYIQHVSPFNDRLLPPFHRFEHIVIRNVREWSMFDIELGQYVDPDNFEATHSTNITKQ